MKVYRVLLSPALLAIVLAGGWVAWWTSAPAQAAGTWNTISVPVRGVVAGKAETVRFSGQAKVESKIAPDPDFNRPTLVLTIDLSGVGGEGAQSRARYVISGPEQQNRSVTDWYLLEFDFPFARSGSDLPTTRSGTATFALTVDTTTGAVTSASASIK